MLFPTKPTLYALLIAIGDYRPPVGKLAGASGDLRDVRAYLEEVESKYFAVNIRTLTEADATHANIVTACEAHFTPAGSGDSVLLYFSGHGTREYAHTSVWPSETDALLECLVCYDGVIHDGDGGYTTNLLADKELRYLLHRAGVGGAHVSAIFDCCNSGENTRSTLPGTVPHRFTRPGSGEPAFPRRSLNKFYFWEELKGRALVDGTPQPLAKWLPEGRHVQLAACRGREFAYENLNSKRGAFTEALLASLRAAGGRITYRDLQVEVGNRLRGHYDQRPETYASTHPADVYLTFLGKSSEPRPNYGTVQYNQPAGASAPGSWTLSLGSLSGRVMEGTKVAVATPCGEVKAKVVRLNPAFSELSFAPASAPDPAKTYHGVPAITHVAALPIMIVATEDVPAATRLRFEQLLSDQAGVRNTSRSEEARYMLSLTKKTSRLTLPGDHRSLVLPVDISSGELNERWNKYLHHLIEWHRLLDLENLDPGRFWEFPLRITTSSYTLDGNEFHLPNREYHQLPYLSDGNKKQHRVLNLQLGNIYHEELFVALLAFGRDFFCTAKFLTPSVVNLQPGQSTAIFNETVKPGQLRVEPDDYLVDARWTIDTVWIKYIASTSESALKEAVRDFELPSLPHPVRSDHNGTHRGMGSNVAPQTKADWITKTVRFDFALQ